MCQGCWEEYLELDLDGQPVVNEQVLTAVPLIKAGDGYGPLHIVIDDWNLEDNNIEFCRAEAIGHPDESLFHALAAMTVPERATAMAIADGYLRIGS